MVWRRLYFPNRTPVFFPCVFLIFSPTHMVNAKNFPDSCRRDTTTNLLLGTVKTKHWSDGVPGHLFVQCACPGGLLTGRGVYVLLGMNICLPLLVFVLPIWLPMVQYSLHKPPSLNLVSSKLNVSLRWSWWGGTETSWAADNLRWLLN